MCSDLITMNPSHFYKREKEERNHLSFVWCLKDCYMQTVCKEPKGCDRWPGTCVLWRCGWAAVGVLVLPGRGAAWTYMQMVNCPRALWLVSCLGKQMEWADSLFTFCFRHLNIHCRHRAILPANSSDSPWKWWTRQSQRRGCARAFVYTGRKAKKFKTGPFGAQPVLQYYEMKSMVKSIACDWSSSL